MILNFDDYIVDKYQSSTLSKNGERTEKDTILPKYYNIFFSRRGYCPSCKRKTKKVSEDLTSIKYDFYANTAWQCQTCGWWEVQFHFGTDFDYVGPRDDDFYTSDDITIYHALVKKFAVTDLSLPLNSLLTELNKNKKILHHIHPTKFEELSQYVLSSYFNCKVYHVGKSGDGGVDLIMILKDKPVLVQVKRRSKEDAIESVATVRDILGTLFIRKSRRGMVMSTATRFSKPSLKVKEDLLRDGRLEYFELVDLKKFCEMLDLIRHTQPVKWKAILKDFRYFQAPI